MELVKSKYNIFAKVTDNCFVGFNTLHGSLLLLDKEAHDTLKTNTPNLLTPDQINVLSSNGFVKDAEINELEMYKHWRNQRAYDTNHLYIFFTITKECNCACGYCFQTKDLKKEIQNVSESNAIKVRKFIESNYSKFNFKSFEIDFFGGEPFVHFARLQEEIVYYTKWANTNKINVSYRIYTNGTILNERMLDFLSQHPIKDLQITLDGPRSIHDANRPFKNGKGTFSLIVNNLRKLKQRKIPFILRVNYDKKSVWHFNELLNSLIESDLSGIALYPYAVQAMTHECGNYKEAISEDEITKLLPTLWEAALEKGFIVPLKIKPSYMYCSASRLLSFAINNNASVFKCALLQEDDKNMVGKIGNNGGIESLLPEYYRWFSRDPTTFSKCSKCLLLPICNGGCAGSSLHKNGTYFTNNCYENNLFLLRKKLLLHFKYYLAKKPNEIHETTI